MLIFGAKIFAPTPQSKSSLQICIFFAFIFTNYSAITRKTHLERGNILQPYLSDVHAGDAGEMKGLQGHLGGGLPDALSADGADRRTGLDQHAVILGLTAEHEDFEVREGETAHLPSHARPSRQFFRCCVFRQTEASLMAEHPVRHIVQEGPGTTMIDFSMILKGFESHEHEGVY